MRRLLAAPVIVGLLVLTGCQVDTAITIDVGSDGSGTVEVLVEMDDAAVAAVDGLDGHLRVEDLADAGWTVDGPVRTAVDGVTRIWAVKAFAVPERLPGVLRDIAGPEVFEDVALVRERSFARTSWTLTGDVDLSAGLGLFSDPQLEATLSGLTLGLTEAQLHEMAGCPDGDCDPAAAFGFDLAVVLPDGGSGNGVIESGVAHWTLTLGEALDEPFLLEWTVEDRAPRLWRTAAAIAAVLLVLVVAFQIVRRVVGRQAGPAAPSSGTKRTLRPTRRSREIVEEAPQSGDPNDRSLQLLVLGGVGVIWDGGTDPEGLLVTFVRERGGIADPREIADRYRAASLGHVSPADFWSSIGVEGDVDEIDAEYLARVQIRPDVVPFLDRMSERQLPVACLTNAVLPWSVHLRERFGLDELVAHWVVSGEVGARKPSQAMFEALRRMSGIAFPNMLLIDSESSTLEAARGVGMSTVLLRGSALIPEGFPHPVIDGFAELFRPADPAPPAEAETQEPEPEEPEPEEPEPED